MFISNDYPNDKFSHLLKTMKWEYLLSKSDSIQSQGVEYHAHR